ncbi:MAG: ABC transporter ATP-binding protein [Bacteroidota bacterium]
MIELKQVDKIYQSSAGEVHALKSVSLTIPQGEHVMVTGKSGSGKSTLLNVISGIDRPEEGEIRIHDTCLNDLKEGELALWRGRNIGIVFQFYQLFPTLSALDNIRFAMELVGKIPFKERQERAAQLLDQVGLLDKARKFPNELSGGEKQRVAIARALANDPAIIVADEPTGNLDSKTSEQIDHLFSGLNEMGKTLIIVTHEDIRNKRFDRLVHIIDGHLA